jgi:hypothetical protein
MTRKNSPPPAAAELLLSSHFSSVLWDHHWKTN